MALPKVIGIETEYGIVVRGVADANPITSSSLLVNVSVVSRLMLIGERYVQPIPSVLTLVHGIRENYVVDWTPAVGRGMRACSSPDDFTEEVFGSEHRIQSELQVVTRGGIAVQIERAGGF